MLVYFVMYVMTGYFALCVAERVQFKGKCDSTTAIKSYVCHLYYLVTTISLHFLNFISFLYLFQLFVMLMDIIYCIIPY